MEKQEDWKAKKVTKEDAEECQNTNKPSTDAIRLHRTLRSFKNKGNSYTAKKSLEGVEKDIDLTGITARIGPNDTARRPNAKNDTTTNPIAAVEGEAAAVAAAGSLADSLGPDD